MDVQQKESSGQGKFFIEENGRRLAALVYAKQNGLLVIEHTEVDKALRGRNIGFDLVHKAVDYARENGVKISPVCPFARKQFEKNAEWKDVMA